MQSKRSQDLLDDGNVGGRERCRVGEAIQQPREHGVDLLPPDPGDVELVDGIIYKELMLGRVTRDAERALKTVITMKEKQGAQAIVLACTELELVVDTDANVLPVYDSTDIHCRAAADWILG